MGTWACGVLALLLAAAAGAQPRGCEARQSGALWSIAQACRDPGDPARCLQNPSLPVQLLVDDARVSWNDRYIAIKDLKMTRPPCDRDADFFHGLAIPLARVCGVEDDRRQSAAGGVWAFAWSVARRLEPPVDEDDIALAVEPPYLRSQNQLHVHIVRLLDAARARFPRDEAPGAACAEHVDDLREVWTAADRQWACRRRLSPELPRWYGALVVRETDGGGALVPGYRVVTDDASVELLYTRARCRAARGPRSGI